jgi:predicted acylesterase/phospholipase RssA
MAAQRRSESPAVEHAQELFRAWTNGGEPTTPRTAKELIDLGAQLVREQRFAYARRVLEHVATNEPAEQRRWAQQRALATYKDRDLRGAAALEHALDSLGNLAECRDSETLGIGGAVYKRLWELDGQRRHLDRALACYRRGYEVGADGARAYPGINAAFVLDLLAREDVEDLALVGGSDERVNRRRAEARRIREEIVAHAPPGAATDWWEAVTLVEAHLGLGEYELARERAKTAAALRASSDSAIAPWQLESTARQLVALASMRLRDGETFAESAAGAVVAELFAPSSSGLPALAQGKVGLALSGGGFRASFFHIGVVAALAERDALRHVEVLSCVSGGSILGAHLYLELKKLLEEKPDGEIGQRDYVELVRKVADDFLAGVQMNIRTRVAANPITSLRTLFQPGFTRTRRNGELFEKLLYSRVKDANGVGGAPRAMPDLTVQPDGHSGRFRPQDENWHRSAKVPTLVLNATTLNTGHNWQFTATSMGEPPAGADASADRNDRLRRMYYDEAPETYRRLRLGLAVAASACVPGLFEPIVLDRLYAGLTLRLVDGGVYDNQGIDALLGQDCSVVLVSDASGQMPTVADVVADPFGVALRSNSVLMARVRRAEYADLDLRRRAGVLHGLMYVHLRQGLGARVRSWTTCTDPYDPLDLDRGGEPAEAGAIPSEIQSLLAEIRTDLDSFTEIEAYALMASGYRLTQQGMEQALTVVAPPREPEGGWPFQPVLDAIAQGRTRELRRQLEVSRNRALKLWRLDLSRAPRDAQHPPSFGRLPARARNGAFRIASGVVIGVLGPIVGGLHLAVFDRRYLAKGRLKHLARD